MDSAVREKPEIPLFGKEGFGEILKEYIGSIRHSLETVLHPESKRILQAEYIGKIVFLDSWSRVAVSSPDIR